MSTNASLSAAEQVQLLSDPAQLQQLARQLVALQAESQAHQARLAAALAQATQTIEQQCQLLDTLTHDLALLKRCLFGSRRERFGADDPRQQLLFGASPELSAAAPVATAAPADIEEQSQQRKRGHGRKPLPQFLPRQTLEHTLSEEELGCPCCGGQRQKISQRWSVSNSSTAPRPCS